MRPRSWTIALRLKLGFPRFCLLLHGKSSCRVGDMVVVRGGEAVYHLLEVSAGSNTLFYTISSAVRISFYRDKF
jgi:hypothetical protein